MKRSLATLATGVLATLISYLPFNVNAQEKKLSASLEAVVPVQDLKGNRELDPFTRFNFDFSTVLDIIGQSFIDYYNNGRYYGEMHLEKNFINESAGLRGRLTYTNVDKNRLGFGMGLKLPDAGYTMVTDVSIVADVVDTEGNSVDNNVIAQVYHSADLLGNSGNKFIFIYQHNLDDPEEETAPYYLEANLESKLVRWGLIGGYKFYLSKNPLRQVHPEEKTSSREATHAFYLKLGF